MPTASTDSKTADVVIVGGGLIGSAVAWRLAQAGRRVVVVTGERSAAASQVAAGMLAPVTETTFTEQALLGLTTASLELFAGFATELESAGGLPAGLRRTPTLSIAYDADDAARMATLADYLSRLGLESARLTSREARKVELTAAVNDAFGFGGHNVALVFVAP